MCSHQSHQDLCKPRLGVRGVRGGALCGGLGANSPQVCIATMGHGTGIDEHVTTCNASEAVGNITEICMCICVCNHVCCAHLGKQPPGDPYLQI
jgi:hypothetical protein